MMFRSLAEFSSPPPAATSFECVSMMTAPMSVPRRVCRGDKGPTKPIGNTAETSSGPPPTSARNAAGPHSLPLEQRGTCHVSSYRSAKLAEMKVVPVKPRASNRLTVFFLRARLDHCCWLPVAVRSANGLAVLCNQLSPPSGLFLLAPGWLIPAELLLFSRSMSLSSKRKLSFCVAVPEFAQAYSGSRPFQAPRD
jgi:hypothetical protein